MGLHIQQLRIAVGVTVKGEPKLIYLGRDSAKCDAALVDAGPEFAEVGAIPRGTIPTVVRYPAADAQKAKARADEAKAREDATRNAAQKAAEDKLAQSKKLAAEANATLKALPKTDK